jgi:uncharacterized protein (TIGR00251 family)
VKESRVGTTSVVGLHGDAVRIRIIAPPVDGAANEALVIFLAKLLEVSPSSVRLLSGETSRSKVVLIAGADVEHVRASLGV